MRILIIEDDERLSELMRLNLEREGFPAEACADGEDGLHLALQQAYDLILLDRMLPCLDGLALLRRLREGGVSAPVLFVTALGEVGDRVDGLDAGADDYLVKPFAIEELLARVRALTRRPRAIEASQELRCGDLVFDRAMKRLAGRKGTAALSRREADLCEALVRNAGNTLTRGILLARVWGPDAAVEDGSLDSYIHFLRAHIRATGSRVKIVTQRGVGYRMEAGDV